MRADLLRAAAAMGLVACQAGDAFWCGPSGCEFTEAEWRALSALAWPDGLHFVDASNAFVDDPAAIELGHALYFDGRLSGRATLVDMLERPTQYARAPKGEPVGVSCATCHVPTRAGADFTTMAGDVSVGAGLYDVNSQQTLNAAAYELPYWNGRVDSLWAQAAAVMESNVSMNGDRLAIAWTMFEHYRTPYARVFARYPQPLTDAGQALVTHGVGADGTCARIDGACPAGLCRSVATDAGSACVPRFPAHGHRGSVAGCQWGSATEPFGDAFDCMAPDDQNAITRVFVNVAKAIAAYEFTLVSKDSRFDRFVVAGPTSGLLDGPERRGAKLFVGKAACVSCHRTYLFSDSRFHNVGVPQVGVGVPAVADCPSGDPVCDCVNGRNCLPWGAYDGLTKLKTGFYRRDSVWSDDATDTSRAQWDAPPAASLIGAWRTPSLRDVALTAPYMHDGLYAQLIDVVQHYNRGGAATGYAGQKAPQMAPLRLTTDEASDLVAFLGTLTGAPLPEDVTDDPCRRVAKPSSCP